MGIDEDLQKVVDAKSEGKEKLAEIVKRVKAGESLGSPMKDFLFVCYGDRNNTESEKKISELQKRINGSKDQQILLVHASHEEKGEHGCFGGGWMDEVIYHMQLGVLSGELSFDMNEGYLVLPMESHVSKGHEFFDRYGLRDKKWELQAGDIRIPVHRVYSPPAFYMLSGTSSHNELDLILGDVNVELYFCVGASMFKPYKERKGKKAKEELRKELLEFSRSVDEDYMDALRLLEVEPSQYFSQRYEEQVLEKKRAVVNSIMDEKDVKHNLHKAIELGLHKEERSVELQPGITMNVPEYILGRCEEYKIEIPE